MIILISIIIVWSVISTFVMHQIHERKFLDAYNRGRRDASQEQNVIHEVRNNYFFRDAYELGRKHAIDDLYENELEKKKD